MIKCTINGKEVEVKPGSTIIEAFYQTQTDLAHYCYHPALSVAGVCRLCMVEIEGNPRVQIACNTTITEGMKINNTSEKVKEAVQWGMDFHLINHPLDCPICDQAGECGLQEQYMQYGKYDSEMAAPKVKKHKVVDLGERVVLDSERCILCSRCVRFTDEVSKTNELGIFNRGDHAEIGTFEGRPLNNKYSVNTVDICPVGALTSKDFRFRQRVWYLKDAETICTGCSTGCNVKVYYNKEGLFRVKPVLNKEVNGYWMCDEGRDVYKFVNREARWLDAQVTQGGKTEHILPLMAARKVGETLRADPKSAALVLTGQYSNEEYQAALHFFKKELGIEHIYHWVNNAEKLNDFDGLLLRGDRNPNTKGLMEAMASLGLKTHWKDLVSGLTQGSIKTVVVAGPENQGVYPDIKERITELSKARNLVWLGSGKNEQLESLKGDVTLLPMKSYIEKSGTYLNFSGINQKTKKVVVVVPNALGLTEVVDAFAGRDVRFEVAPDLVGHGRVHNEFTVKESHPMDVVQGGK